MVHQSRKDFVVIWGLYAFALISLFFLSSVTIPLSLFKLSSLLPKTPQTIPEPLYDIHAFEGIQIEAKAYIVYDAISGNVVAERDAYTPRTLASITKIMTALTALRVASSTTLITVNQKDINGTFDLGLSNKQIWSLDRLLKYTLTFSSNDGAQIVAEELLGTKLFVAAMNEYAKELGFAMVFTQPDGLDLGSQSGGIGSAYDVARMMAFARTRMSSILDATTKPRLTVRASTGLITGIPNTNQHVGEFFGIEASKTGFTEEAGGNLVISVDVTLGRPVIIVVLDSTREARFSDAQTLYQALIKSLEKAK